MSSERKFIKSIWAKIILALAAIIVIFFGFELFAKVYSSNTNSSTELSPINLTKNIASDRGLGGSELRLAAWKASFTERGLSVPSDRPRDGIRGWKITRQACRKSSECNKEVNYPGILEIDKDGFQYAGDPTSAKPKILIVGSSVSWGAGASDIENTYFANLYGLLKNDYPNVGLIVLGNYGSTGIEDLHSFVTIGLDTDPDVVLFLNGLNDVTVEEDITSKNASNFIHAMDVAQNIADQNGIETVFVRQPIPDGKLRKSDLEERILELSNSKGRGEIVTYYDSIGLGLKKITESNDSHYIDSARCFDIEEETTFSDQWHFSDPGHKLLAECIYKELSPILKQTYRQNGSK